MKIRNKRNGTNVLAYKAGATIVKQIIPGGAVVEITNLISLSQVVNAQDFKRGWFEVVAEEKAPVQEVQVKVNKLEKAKKEAEEYSEEEQKEKQEKKNKK